MTGNFLLRMAIGVAAVVATLMLLTRGPSDASDPMNAVVGQWRNAVDGGWPPADGGADRPLPSDPADPALPIAGSTRQPSAQTRADVAWAVDPSILNLERL
jgi:hypothetical protein